MGGSAGGVTEAKPNNAESNAAVRSASARYQEEVKSRIPINRGIISMAAMMLAADRIAANVLAANPALYRKYLGVSEEWLRSHRACEAEAAEETLDEVEQMARRLVVAMRLAKLPATTAQEEQRA
jgi:pyrroloquinoline quinone (PQQ) biosynthesis protein C